MNNRPSFKLTINVIAIVSVLCFGGLFFAPELKAAGLPEDVSGLKQEQAQKYRELGLEYQRSGNLAEALSFYQKAIVLYPSFDLVYNDLGVVYEAMGLLDRAEESYLKSIKINPAYAGVYTNLALFYENQRNLDRAAFYWDKRSRLGVSDDPWKQKAAKRLADIRMSLSGRPLTDIREDDVLSLMRDVGKDKIRLVKIDETPAQKHFKKAKLSFKNGDMAMATKEALDAQYLDPNNSEIAEFIEKAELGALTR